MYKGIENKGDGMMERLTEKQSSGYDLKAMNGEYCNRYCEQQRVETCNECVIYQAIQKLAEYESLEEQGLLLRLPCKVGDTVYALRYGEENDFIIVETKIIEIRQNINGTFFEPLISRKAYKVEDFGKEVFLTKEEAEQKLKKMEND